LRFFLMILAPFVNYNMGAKIPVSAEAAHRLHSLAG
jgi:hypothetical protein